MPQPQAHERIHLHAADLPHPAVGMLGRATTRRAVPDDLVVGGDNPSWKIHYFARGVYHWRVGDERLDLAPRTWLVTPPDVIHGGADAVREAGEFFWCHLLLHGGRRAPGMDREETARLRRRLGRQAGPHRAAEDRAPLWQRLFQAAQARDPWRRARFRAAFLELVFALFADARAPEDDTCSAPIQRAIDWLRLNLDRQAGIEALARQAGLGRSRFCDRFREETGMSPAEYRNRLRIEEAKRLLAETGRSVTDIALTLGYASSQSFATAFRRGTGKSPSSWRSSSSD